jgi:5-methylcytosine-specific restriction endonuclease McrA
MDKLVFRLPSPVNGKTAGASVNWEAKKPERYSKQITSGRWKAVRELVLSKSPLCGICGRPATEVHHILKDDNLFFCVDNLAPICSRCHALEQSAKKRGINTAELFKK